MKISELPPKYKKLAEQRRDRYKQTDNLQFAFHWRSTPEGGQFWANCQAASSAKELPLLPKFQKLEKNYVIKTNL